jgi:hypothetical protein
MPIDYRRDVRRHYHAFIDEGMRRYASHRAMQAGLTLATGLLQGSLDAAAANPDAFTHEILPARAFRMLADHGVTAGQLLARVAEVVAFIDHHPERVPSQRFEDHMLSRAVLTLVPWKLRFNPGAKMLRHLGALLRERLMPWALSFTRKLRQDIKDERALVRESTAFDC